MEGVAGAGSGQPDHAEARELAETLWTQVTDCLPEDAAAVSRLTLDQLLRASTVDIQQLDAAVLVVREALEWHLEEHPWERDTATRTRRVVQAFSGVWDLVCTQLEASCRRGAGSSTAGGGAGLGSAEAEANAICHLLLALWGDLLLAKARAGLLGGDRGMDGAPAVGQATSARGSRGDEEATQVGVVPMSIDAVTRIPWGPRLCGAVARVAVNAACACGSLPREILAPLAFQLAGLCTHGMAQLLSRALAIGAEGSDCPHDGISALQFASSTDPKDLGAERGVDAPAGAMLGGHAGLCGDAAQGFSSTTGPSWLPTTDGASLQSLAALGAAWELGLPVVSPALQTSQPAAGESGQSASGRSGACGVGLAGLSEVVGDLRVLTQLTRVVGADAMLDGVLSFLNKREGWTCGKWCREGCCEGFACGAGERGGDEADAWLRWVGAVAVVCTVARDGDARRHAGALLEWAATRLEPPDGTRAEGASVDRGEGRAGLADVVGGAVAWLMVEAAGAALVTTVAVDGGSFGGWGGCQAGEGAEKPCERGGTTVLGLSLSRIVWALKSGGGIRGSRENDRASNGTGDACGAAATGAFAARVAKAMGPWLRGLLSTGALVHAPLGHSSDRSCCGPGQEAVRSLLSAVESRAASSHDAGCGLWVGALASASALLQAGAPGCQAHFIDPALLVALGPGPARLLLVSALSCRNPDSAPVSDGNDGTQDRSHGPTHGPSTAEAAEVEADGIVATLECASHFLTHAASLAGRNGSSVFEGQSDVDVCALWRLAGAWAAGRGTEWGATAGPQSAMPWALRSRDDLPANCAGTSNSAAGAARAWAALGCDMAVLSLARLSDRVPEQSLGRVRGALRSLLSVDGLSSVPSDTQRALFMALTQSARPSGHCAGCAPCLGGTGRTALGEALVGLFDKVLPADGRPWLGAMWDAAYWRGADVEPAVPCVDLLGTLHLAAALVARGGSGAGADALRATLLALGRSLDEEGLARAFLASGAVGATVPVPVRRADSGAELAPEMSGVLATDAGAESGPTVGSAGQAGTGNTDRVDAPVSPGVGLDVGAVDSCETTPRGAGTGDCGGTGEGTGGGTGGGTGAHRRTRALRHPKVPAPQALEFLTGLLAVCSSATAAAQVPRSFVGGGGPEGPGGEAVGDDGVVAGRGSEGCSTGSRLERGVESLPDMDCVMGPNDHLDGQGDSGSRDRACARIALLLAATSRIAAAPATQCSWLVAPDAALSALRGLAGWLDQSGPRVGGSTSASGDQSRAPRERGPSGRTPRKSARRASTGAGGGVGDGGGGDGDLAREQRRALAWSAAAVCMEALACHFSNPCKDRALFSSERTESDWPSAGQPNVEAAAVATIALRSLRSTCPGRRLPFADADKDAPAVAATGGGGVAETDIGAAVALCEVLATLTGTADALGGAHADVAAQALREGALALLGSVARASASGVLPTGNWGAVWTPGERQGAIRTWCLATHANKFFASECQAAACSEPLWATSLSLLALLANAQGDLSPTSPALADVGELRDASGARAEAQATGSRAVRLSPRAALRTVTAVDAVAQLAWSISTASAGKVAGAQCLIELCREAVGLLANGAPVAGPDASGRKWWQPPTSHVTPAYLSALTRLQLVTVGMAARAGEIADTDGEMEASDVPPRLPVWAAAVRWDGCEPDASAYGDQAVFTTRSVPHSEPASVSGGALRPTGRELGVVLSLLATGSVAIASRCRMGLPDAKRLGAARRHVMGSTPAEAALVVGPAQTGKADGGVAGSVGASIVPGRAASAVTPLRIGDATVVVMRALAEVVGGVEGAPDVDPRAWSLNAPPPVNVLRVVMLPAMHTVFAAIPCTGGDARDATHGVPLAGDTGASAGAAGASDARLPETPPGLTDDEDRLVVLADACAALTAVSLLVLGARDAAFTSQGSRTMPTSRTGTASQDVSRATGGDAADTIGGDRGKDAETDWPASVRALAWAMAPAVAGVLRLARSEAGCLSRVLRGGEECGARVGAHANGSGAVVCGADCDAHIHAAIDGIERHLQLSSLPTSRGEGAGVSEGEGGVEKGASVDAGPWVSEYQDFLEAKCTALAFAFFLAGACRDVLTAAVSWAVTADGSTRSGVAGADVGHAMQALFEADAVEEAFRELWEAACEVQGSAPMHGAEGGAKAEESNVGGGDTDDRHAGSVPSMASVHSVGGDGTGSAAVTPAAPFAPPPPHDACLPLPAATVLPPRRTALALVAGVAVRAMGASMEPFRTRLAACAVDMELRRGNSALWQAHSLNEIMEALGVPRVTGRDGRKRKGKTRGGGLQTAGVSKKASRPAVTTPQAVKAEGPGDATGGQADGGGGVGAGTEVAAKPRRRRKRRRAYVNPFVAAARGEGLSDGEADDYDDLEDFIVCKPGRDYSTYFTGRWAFGGDGSDEEEAVGGGGDRISGHPATPG